MDFLHDNEILYNKCIIDYKERSKREAVWAKFCEENNLDKVVPERVHTLRESHTHEVRPGGTSADREAVMDQRQF